jgi:hypothetical protein
MGEAKRRQFAYEAMRRQKFKEGLEYWLFEASPTENANFDELNLIRPIEVGRMPAMDLEQGGFERGRCHDNAIRFERLTGGEWKAVLGWSITVPSGDYLCHSVVSDGERWLCVTPTEDGSVPFFDFVPDPHLEIGDDVMIRRGVAVGPGVRRDPQATTAYVQHYLDRLEAGDPIEVMVQDMVEEAETMFAD